MLPQGIINRHIFDSMRFLNFFFFCYIEYFCSVLFFLLSFALFFFYFSFLVFSLIDRRDRISGNDDIREFTTVSRRYPGIRTLLDISESR